MSWYLTYGQSIRYDRVFDSKEEAIEFIRKNPGYKADGLYNLQYGVSVKEGDLDDCSPDGEPNIDTSDDDADEVSD